MQAFAAMHDYLLFAVLGLIAGAAYASLAMGLVTVYRGTGVINFAQAAIAAWGAYVYAELSSAGDLVLPIGRVHLGSAWSPWPAFAVAVGCAGVLGLLIQAVVFRPLRGASPLAKVV